jgi:hypothetical protein
MADLLQLTKDYHKRLCKRLESSGLSSAQSAVHRRILDLGKDASDVNDLEARKSRENLTFALSRAISVDNWRVKAKAAKEAEDTLAAKVYEDTAESAEKAADSMSLASTVDSSSTKGMEKLTEQEEIRNAFIEAVFAVFDYRAVHPVNIEKKKKISEDLRIYSSKLESKGSKFEELVKVPPYRNTLPLTEAQWQQVLKTYKDMQFPSVDPEAKAKLDEEVKDARESLKGKSAQMKEISQYLEEKGTRLAYLGIAPWDEPGPYVFEKIWEGGRNE